MNWKKIIGIIAGIALIAAFVMRLKNNKETAADRVYQYDRAQAINVQVDTIQLERLHTGQPYTGTFEPFRETKISAEVQGKIETIFADDGSRVKKGQKLLQLDDVLLQAQLHVLNTQIANIQAEHELRLQANQIKLEGLSADVDRYRVLAASDAIEGVQLEKAEIQLKTAENQRATLLQRSALKNAEAQKAQLLEQINKTTIKAPFNGIVTAKLAEEGSFAAPGVPLLQITDISRLKFTVNVSEEELSQFAPGQNYDVTVDAYPELLRSGKATMIGSKANSGSSFPVQFLVENTAGGKIKSGMFGKALWQTAEPEKGIVIPASAVVGTADQPQVYRVDSGKAVLRDVTVGKMIQNRAVIAQGLKEGDIIVTGGFINLFDGANVASKKQ